MNSFDKLCSLGMDNYGIVTSSDAKSLGLSARVMSSLVKSGRLLHKGYGVFKLAICTSSEGMDRYAEAVAFGGKDAVLYGESVLSMLNLAFVNPSVICVATPHRIRRTLPSWVRLVRVHEHGAKVSYYKGIPCQPLSLAIRHCMKAILPERILSALEAAQHEGWLTDEESLELKLALKTGASI